MFYQYLLLHYAAKMYEGTRTARTEVPCYYWARALTLWQRVYFYQPIGGWFWNNPRISSGISTHHQELISLYLQYLADTVIWAPDDGWTYHPKQVEQFADINKLYIDASCWIITDTYYAVHGPLNIKFFLYFRGGVKTLCKCSFYCDHFAQKWIWSNAVPIISIVKLKCWQEDLFQCLFVHRKSHMCCTVFETVISRSAKPTASDQTYGTPINLQVTAHVYRPSTRRKFTIFS